MFNPEKFPAFHDPFAGGGSLPLEAQRLGLESYASDLNPVAVLINKAMIEIPPKFAGQPPVNPKSRAELGVNRTWQGASGLAEDVRYYGQWMRDEAEKRIGHLYPKIEITAEMAQERPDLKPYLGQKLTVIAWLWARTVKSPNPAFAHVDVPLASSFMLSTKAGKEAYVEIPSPTEEGYRFVVKVGRPENFEQVKNGTKLARGANFQCVMSGSPISPEYIYAEANAGRMGARMMAIVAEGERGRVYLSPTQETEDIALKAIPEWQPDLLMPANPRWFSPPLYGLKTYGSLFTPRQLVALTTFSDLVLEAREKVLEALTPSPSPSEGEGDKRGMEWHPEPVPESLLVAARKLRKNMTDAEQLLWSCLRGKQLEGYRFRRQHPIDRFVLDFYCPAVKLAIELDGSQHGSPEGKARDAERTAWLNAQGIRVIRFWNAQVFKNLEGVLQEIWEEVKSPPLPNPPPAGEGVKPPISESLKPLIQQQENSQTSTILKPLPRWGRPGGGSYADAVTVYLALGVDRLADRASTICGWDNGYTKIRNTFGRQAIPMTWDYAEGNVFSESTGNFSSLLEWVEKFLIDAPSLNFGQSAQQDASTQSISKNKIISTDPPYYDNIGYADLSDFFYVWLRRSLQSIYPELFSTLAVPKAEELVATPYRHGSKEKAETFFLAGMTQAMHRLATQAHPAFSVTIYYAFKQSETESSGTTSTGWETFLDAVIRAGFTLTGTWPMRTELSNRMIGSGTNALASSIILVCRKRPADAPTATRREFLNALKRELPIALKHLQRGNIAPVDLAQSAIGPGMAVYTRYAKVLDAAGKSLTVREALALINEILDEVLAEQEGDFDSDTRWALSWFDQFGFTDGPYGDAETLSTAKNTSVNGMVEAGILVSKAGKVRLFRPEELPEDWDPDTDPRLTAWEIVHHLVRVLEKSSESAAAVLVAKLGSKAEAARELAYRLYALCERRKRAPEALSYNGLVQSWPEILRLAADQHSAQPQQMQMELNP
nr:DUF559 domain-containing protein [Anthocerotibacter panamensis]